MTEYDNTNRGVLFFAKEKKSTNSPDYKGNINVNGVDFWISAWNKTTKAGDDIISLSIQPKEAGVKHSTQASNNNDDVLDDDVPF